MSDVAPELVVSAGMAVIKGCCGLFDSECSCTSATSEVENS